MKFLMKLEKFPQKVTLDKENNIKMRIQAIFTVKLESKMRELIKNLVNGKNI